MVDPPGIHFFSVKRLQQHIAGIVHEPVGMSANGVILSIHGFDGQRIASHRILVKASRAWAKAGWISARFDHRGCGLSDGNFWHSAWPERFEDVVVVAADLRTRYPGQPLVLHGFSDGCKSTLKAVSHVHPAAIVLWSPVVIAAATPPGWPQPAWQRHPIDRTPVRPLKGLWISHRYFIDSNRWDAVPIGNLPMLITIGDRDEYIDPSMAILREQYNDLIVEVVEGADHLYCSPESEESVIYTTKQWLYKVIVDRNGR